MCLKNGAAFYLKSDPVSFSQKAETVYLQSKELLIRSVSEENFTQFFSFLILSLISCIS